MNEAQYKAAVLAAGKAWISREFFRGRDYSIPITFNDVDYSAATFAAQIRLTPDAAGDPLASFSVTAPVFSGGNTTVALTLTGGQTSALPAASETGLTAKFYWDLKIIVGGLIDTIAAGPVTLIGKVTA